MNSDGTTYTSPNCSNIYCHSRGTASASPYAAPITAPSWTGAVLDCTGCHGGDATSGNLISTNAHSAHVNDGPKNKAGRSFGCSECHTATVSGNTTLSSFPNHVNKLLNVKFNNAASLNRDSDGPLYNSVSTTATPTGATKTPGAAGYTCSNVYCHSIGNLDFTTKALVTAGGTSFRTPAWSPVGGGLSCDACHGDGAGKTYPTYASGPAGSTTANSHGKHVVSANQTCNMCHATTTISTTTTAASMTLVTGGAHLNRTEDVVFATIGTKTGSYNGAGKTCSATYCHGTAASVAWGGTTDCASCHDASSALSTGATNSNRHWVHYESAATATVITTANSATAGSYVYGCGNCHDAAQIGHATGPAGTVYAEVKFNIVLSSGTTTTSGTYSVGTSTLTDTRGYVYSQNGTCSNLYCHSNGAPFGTVYTTRTVTWNQAVGVSPNDCSVCHGGRVGSTTPISSNRHDTHVVSYSMGCEKCHQATTTTGTTITNKANHVDGTKDVSLLSILVSTTPYDLVNHRCSNIYCHSQGTSGTTFNASYSIASASIVAWNGAQLACDACHTGGTSAGPTYTSGSPKANSHPAHVTTTTGVCETCHFATTTTGTSITNFANHADKNYDILASGGAVSFLTPTVGNFTTPTTCSNISCHGGAGTSATWGNKLTCASCHLGTGDLNDFTYSGGTGTTARIDSTQWSYSGHGKTTGLYDSTTNSAANFPGKAGTGDPCLYCHDSSVGHGATPNFFRLRSFTSGTAGNQVCLNCHATGSAGVSVVGGQTVTAASRIDKYHYGSQHATTLSGGQFCWDCHEPHGDSSSAAGPIAMIQAKPAMVSDSVTGKPTSIVSTTVTFTSQTTPASYGTMTAPYDRVCNVCHTYKAADPYKMVHYTNTTSDGHNSGTLCTQCHKHSPDTTINGEAFKGGGCDGCHSYDTTGGGTAWGKNQIAIESWAGHVAHIEHLKTRFTITLNANTDQFGTGAAAALCGTCHTNTVSNHSTSGGGTRSINFGDGTYRANGAAGFSFLFGATTPTYNGVVGVSSATSPKTCSNISCHFQTTPLWQSY
jgi:predicted CxxxxCH...CXXCH cytochrome family protein